MFDKRLWGLVNQTRRRVTEALPYGEVPAQPLAIDSTEVHFVQITSTTTTDGRYPGSLYIRESDATTAVFTLQGSAGDIWVQTPNGELLFTGKYFESKLTGVKTADGKQTHEVSGVQFPMLWGKLDGTLNYQSSATLSVWSGTGAGSDTWVNVTVHDGTLSTSQTVATNTFITAHWDALSGIYRLGNAQCAS